MPGRTETSPPLSGGRLRDIRLSRGLTQEGLAERAGLSLGVVKKVERGGSARLETYHALARALGVRTSALFDPSGPHATRRDDRDKLDLMPLRQAIAPPMSLSGRFVSGNTVEPEPDLRGLRRTAAALASSYYGDDYAALAGLLPALVRSARTAVDHFDGGPQRAEALRIRADVLQMAGRYLTQVRAYDLAHIALRDAVTDAVTAADRAAAASAVYLQGWTLIRQGRLDETEQLAVATADDIEPRISRATRVELGVWGRLLVRGSSAAARNNRPDAAREMLRLARTAGSALGAGTAAHPYGWGKFNWSTVALQAVENHVVGRRPDRVLGLSTRLAASTVTMTSNTWHRHRLDVAQAHAMLGQGRQATDVLAQIHDEAPEWLRHQQLAGSVFQEALRSSGRSLTRQQRELAAFFGVA
ncbi:transcriptional regulator [Streptomyces sp. CC53]|uniref:helix-turn-helix domain-containing protein n=1 Tax=Streptomyces sp. CC53 TaxID=1906740 RepID=UPI0008DD355B|nr:helix-turn-helix transcriptional regulator [Streptomyces sp. CC53]OII62928.1 transcriptional regulator [Streptomyces sp. CC53]